MKNKKCRNCKKRFDEERGACPRCGAEPSPGGLRKSLLPARRFIVLALILLVLAGGAIAWRSMDGMFDSDPRQCSIQEIPDLSALLNMTSEELAKQDIAAVNLACAEGLKDAETLDKRACLNRLDLWASEIAELMKERKSMYRSYHNKTGGSFNQWRSGCIVSYLQNIVGVEYTPEFKSYRPRDYDDTYFFRSAKDVYICGAITDKKRATCASLPVLFASIGRRLGFPIKLVMTRNHLFARWDDGKERFNIECTDRFAEFKPDDFYRGFPATLNEGEEGRMGYLTNLTPEREFASFLHLRGLCLRENERYEEAMEAFLACIRLNPQYSDPPEQNLFVGMVELDIMFKDVPRELRRSRR